MTPEELDTKLLTEIRKLITCTPLTSGGFNPQAGWLQKAQEIRDILIRRSHWDYRQALLVMAASCFVELRFVEDHFLENPVSQLSKGSY